MGLSVHHEFELDRRKPDSGQSVLLCRGKETGALLEGASLVAQFTVASNALLFVTDDCPFEEILHVYLVTARGHVLDALHNGRPYTPGILADLVRIDEQRFVFSFGETAWSLIVRPRARLGLVFSTNGWVRRSDRWLARHWLVIARSD